MQTSEDLDFCAITMETRIVILLFLRRFERPDLQTNVSPRQIRAERTDFTWYHPNLIAPKALLEESATDEEAGGAL